MANQNNKNSDPRKFGMDDDPFKLDSRFAPLAGYNASPPLDLNKTAEQLESQPDPALEAWGAQLPREVLAGNRAKSELRQFIENVDDDTLIEAFQKGGIEDPEEREKIRQEIEDIRQGKEAEKFLQMRPEYYADDTNLTRLTGFLGSHGLDFTAENLCQAYDSLFEGGYLRTDPDAIKPLTEQEELYVGRMIVGGDVVGGLYQFMRFALPSKNLQEIQTTVATDPAFAGLVLEALYFVFRHIQADYRHSPQFVDYMQDFFDGRPPTLELMQTAWQEFKCDAVLAPQRQADQGLPTAEDIDSLSTEEQERLLTETRKLRAHQLRRQRS